MTHLNTDTEVLLLLLINIIISSSCSIKTTQAAAGSVLHLTLQSLVVHVASHQCCVYRLFYAL